MALETTVFDLADFLVDRQDVFYQLQAELEEYDPKHLMHTLDAVLRARGGVDRVAEETGIPEQNLANIARMDDKDVQNLATKVMEAYRPQAETSSRVA